MNNIYIINKAIIHITENTDQLITVNQLAKVVGFSPYHFHRMFRKHTGENIAKFSRRIRLNNSAYQLLTTNMSITEVARESGYSTPSSFTKAFKKMFFFSPREFKHICRLTQKLAQ